MKNDTETTKGMIAVSLKIPEGLKHCDPFTIKRQDLPGGYAYWRGRYTYRCYPAASGEITSYRAITKGDKQVFCIYSHKEGYGETGSRGEYGRAVSVFKEVGGKVVADDCWMEYNQVSQLDKVIKLSRDHWIKIEISDLK